MSTNDFLSTPVFLSTQQQEEHTSTNFPKEQKMITSIFVTTIHLSELGLQIYILSTGTVRGDYGKGEIENILFVHENIKYRTTSLLCKKPYWIPSHGC